MPPKTWTIVYFEKESAVEAVPSTWVVGKNICLWPPYSAEKLQKALQLGEVDTHWPEYKIKVFEDAIFSDYLTARAKAKKAELTSDLNSDDNESNKRRLKKRKVFSSSSSDEENQGQYTKLPNPPAKKKPKRLWLSNISEEVTRTSEETRSQPTPRSVLHHPPARNTIQFEGPTTSSSPGIIICNNTCNKCCDNKKTEKSLFIIKSLCCDILSKIEHLPSHSVNQSSEPNIPQNVLDGVGVVYPMRTTDDLALFDAYFQSAEKYVALVQKFLKIGGSTSGDFIRRCLAPLITNDLAMQYSFAGRKGKLQFNVLQICKALLEAADQIKCFKDRKEAELAIGCWLKRGKARRDWKQDNREDNGVM